MERRSRRTSTLSYSSSWEQPWLRVSYSKRKSFRAHGICQTTVMLLNLFMIGLVMGPSLQQMRPSLPKLFHRWYYAAATIHAILGIAAELLGIYIVLVAGTNIIPQSLRFRKWKPWMRTELLLWFIVLTSGVATYCAWYLGRR